MTWDGDQDSGQQRMDVIQYTAADEIMPNGDGKNE